MLQCICDNRTKDYSPVKIVQVIISMVMLLRIPPICCRAQNSLDSCYMGSVCGLNPMASLQTLDTIPSMSGLDALAIAETPHKNIYELPYSVTGKAYDWHRLWINTATLAGAFIGTLFVLECLPEDATSWNRAELQDVPLFKRWHNHVIKKGPEWDHDKVYFNYILHPYAGAVYFMAARSCGFNMWQSLLYCSCISTIGWEFGVEAFMERPSIQDIFITPLVGSAIGEGFYHLKRRIINNDYRLAGSKALGNIIVFLIDPVNEVVGLFAGNPCRKTGAQKKLDISSSVVTSASGSLNFGINLSCRF